MHEFQAIQFCYGWEVRVEHADEVQLLSKTTAPGMNEVLGVIEELHSYDNSEILGWQAQPSNASNAYGA